MPSQFHVTYDFPVQVFSFYNFVWNFLLDFFLCSRLNFRLIYFLFILSMPFTIIILQPFHKRSVKICRLYHSFWKKDPKLSEVHNIGKPIFNSTVALNSNQLSEKNRNPERMYLNTLHHGNSGIHPLAGCNFRITTLHPEFSPSNTNQLGRFKKTEFKKFPEINSKNVEISIFSSLIQIIRATVRRFCPMIKKMA